MKNILLTVVITLLFSCKKEDTPNWKDHWENVTIKKELLNNPKIHPRIKESLIDTSIIVITTYLKEDIEKYNTLKSLGDINNDGINDSILVIPELYIGKTGDVEEAASILFTDKTIPRVSVDVGCLGTDFFFPVADIDEDGIMELGQYYTSCASRFKSLILIALQDNKWTPQGQVTFDIWFDDPIKEERIMKTGLNSFKMREITTESPDSIIDIWLPFTMKK
ncbi:hypothetical protein [Olleya sp. R77988]|uniref:hypothetical protein n=1 Tax=Olleya sp. R77988 TaxID=3093875 RepID=UPI0037C8A09F